MKEWFKSCNTRLLEQEAEFLFKEAEHLRYINQLKQEIADKDARIANLEETFKERVNVAIAEALPNQYKSVKDSNEPWIAVTTVSVDPEDPQYGEFDLDWNEAFVTLCRQHGYTGINDEEVIDGWFQSVCQNIAWSVFDADGLDGPGTVSPEKLIKATRQKDGRTAYE